MSKVKWIKITTNIFDDEKIQLIESMPESDTIIVIWFKLLALAGKSNTNGLVMISDKVPYTREMLKTLFRRKQSVIDLALHTFEQFGMIETLDNETILISNWEKHQNVNGLDNIREQNRIRQQKYRDKQRQTLLETKEKELDKKNKNKDIEGNVTNNVMEVWNSLPFKSIRTLTDKRKKHINARVNEYTLETVLETIKSLKDIKFFNDNKDSNWFDFDWVFNPNNFVKIIEGKYNNSTSRNEPDWVDDVMSDL